MSRIQLALRNVFSLDLRALAAFRIGLGIVLILEFLSSLGESKIFFSDLGILPNTPEFHRFHGGWNWSLIDLFLSPEFPGVLMVAGLVFSAALILGWRTRWCTFILWVILSSIQSRNPLIINSGDCVLRLALFWGFFLPLDQKAPSDQKTIVSMASAFFIIQLYMVYWFTAMLKWDPTWYGDGTAVYYALNMKGFTRQWAAILLQFPFFCQLLTHATVALESLAPTALIIPSPRQWTRVIVPLIFIFFHLSLAMTLSLGLFPLACIVYWIAILPSPVWDWIENRVGKKVNLVATGKASSELLLKTQNVFLAICFFLVLLSNISSLPYLEISLAPHLNKTVKLGLLDQNWGMYSPRPHFFTEWITIKGTLRSGRVVDLFQKADYSESMPENVVDWHKNVRWRKYFSAIQNRKNPQPLINRLMSYFCGSWEEEPVVAVEVISFKKATPPPLELSEKAEPVEKTVIGSAECSSL